MSFARTKTLPQAKGDTNDMAKRAFWGQLCPELSVSMASDSLHLEAKTVAISFKCCRARHGLALLRPTSKRSSCRSKGRTTDMTLAPYLGRKDCQRLLSLRSARHLSPLGLDQQPPPNIALPTNRPGLAPERSNETELRSSKRRVKVPSANEFK